MHNDYTKFEIARIIGARALQLSMGAPLLIKRPKDLYDPTEIARMEFDSGILPITIKRPTPKKVKRLKELPE
ncbi:DNA-directed RNA polymerase subunit K [Candidatus Woesearchaeota archaeon]|nr:DNA-directed RNA polymerase subunit K [Candidatus Woesearchaeota archaeon]